MRVHGFSLVELSIVLVILGLLVGGILAGQSLIRAAELRSISTDLHRFTAAQAAFRDKYFALPGDMRNATSFWTAAHATEADCLTTAGTSPATCNGNGDGRIMWALAGGENYLYWEHLANAGLVEGTYSGVASSGAEVGGVNIPRGRIPQSGYVAWYTGPWSSQQRERNALLVARSCSSGAYECGIIKPEEAWNIDTKMDDGRADSGNLIAGNGSGETGCVSGTNFMLGSAYILNSSTTTCRMNYVM